MFGHVSPIFVLVLPIIHRNSTRLLSVSLVTAAFSIHVSIKFSQHSFLIISSKDLHFLFLIVGSNFLVFLLKTSIFCSFCPEYSLAEQQFLLFLLTCDEIGQNPIGM